MNSSTYQFITTLKEKYIAFVDVDFTLSNHKEDTDIPELLNHTLANRARSLLKEKGYITVLSTSRTEEMLMSSHAYAQSSNLYGFSRPSPRLITKNGKKEYIPPETYEPRGILDPEIMIASTGTSIMVKQQDGGYKKDTSYTALLPNPLLWRKSMMKTLDMLNQHHNLYTYAPIELESNFEDGKTNIFPPDYRIQLYFQSKEQYATFRSLFLSLHLKNTYLINESDVTKQSYSVFICAKNGKGEAANHVISSLQLPMKEVLVVGDSLPDLLESLLIQAPHATLLLVGRSRIASFISNPQETEYAGDDFSDIKNNIQNISPGVYQLQNHNTLLSIILSDEKTPGLVGPESLIEYLS